MNFKRYQARALETALPTALDLENYLIPMIIGEVGELFGAQAKAHRDNWPPERIAKELAKEYGDICYGVAVALHMLGIHKEPSVDTPPNADGNKLWRFHHRTDDLIWCFEEDEEMLSRLWVDLKKCCLDITTYTFEQVLEMNLAKLADRKARGVIEGSGNDR